MKINPSKTINELITVLAYVIDVDENKKLYHTGRVSILSSLLAKELVTPKKLKEIFYAAVLHDVGGVGLPYHIIHYLKRSDKASQNMLLSHPIIGAQLVSNIPKLTPVAKLILDHHEWIDGHGYPRAKTKNNIPLGSQIIRISDSADIAIQTGHFPKLKDLKKHLALNIDREYPKALFNYMAQILQTKKFFYEIYKPKNVPAIFNQIKERAGLITIPKRIDAVGTTLEILAQIIDMKHPYTAGHSLRVSRYAMAIALAMNLDHDTITKIKWAGLIHDIGKLSLSRRVLDKTTKLTTEEYNKIKKHAQLTQQILNMVSTLKEITPIAAGHHERFEGTGYPSGLKGKDIPLGSRILSVCDAFDAMTSNRPYRKPLTSEVACRELKRHSGTQFDPQIVKEALPLFRNLGL